LLGQCLENVTDDLGAGFVHEPSAANGNMDGGFAWLDMDGDGDDDLLCVSGALSHRLMRWDGWAFHDVTAGSGLPPAAKTFGVIAGDYDDDGLPDVYLLNNGPNQLLHNEGNGVFTDVTAALGVAGPAEMSTAGAWADFDRDGDLDLYVGNYIQGGDFPFKEGWPNRLWVNTGTPEAPVFVDMAPELGVDDVGVFEVDDLLGRLLLVTHGSGFDPADGRRSSGR